MLLPALNMFCFSSNSKSNIEVSDPESGKKKAYINRCKTEISYIVRDDRLKETMINFNETTISYDLFFLECHDREYEVTPVDTNIVCQKKINLQP